jgi:hypothetical protein
MIRAQVRQDRAAVRDANAANHTLRTRGTMLTKLSDRPVSWGRTAALALLIGVVGTALTACASGEQKAEDEAVAQMQSKLSELEDTARSFLQSSPDRDSARREFAREQGPYVYTSNIDGNTITWSIALVGQGGFSTSGTSTVTRLRTCLQLRSADALELKLTTVTCPARFTNSPDFDSTDRDVDLLALGKQDSVTARSPSPDVDMRADNEAYRQRFELPQGLQAKAENHRKRIAAALQEAVKKTPLDRPGAASVLAPLGYVADSVQAYGRSDGPGGLALGVSTDAGCVYGGIRGKVVVLETGGIIADGGCLPAN